MPPPVVPSKWSRSRESRWLAIILFAFLLWPVAVVVVLGSVARITWLGWERKPFAWNSDRGRRPCLTRTST